MDSPSNSRAPRRLFFVSVPRTASNLLVRVLDIHRQPNVFTNNKAGYFFQQAYMTAAAKDPVYDHWTDADKGEIRDAYQQCLDKLEAASQQAQRDNKILFTKEHAFWFVHPAMMLDAGQPGATGSNASREAQQQQQDGLALTLPADVYGPTRTFSPHNKTLFPDEYLRTWHFVFLIRHPALAWPSMYRAMQKIAKLGILDEDGIQGAMVFNMTFRWTRSLFDWCAAAAAEQLRGSPPAPLILDAHDIIHHRNVAVRVCERTGLDRDAVRSEWDGDGNPGLGLQSPQSEVSDRDKEAIRIMTSTLRASNGIIKEKAPATVDIDAEVDKWKDEFGLEAAAMIEKAVRAAMPDYEYLRERSLKV